MSINTHKVMDHFTIDSDDEPTTIDPIYAEAVGTIGETNFSRINYETL
jgi:hypothetical protein